MWALIVLALGTLAAAILASISDTVDGPNRLVRGAALASMGVTVLIFITAALCMALS